MGFAVNDPLDALLQDELEEDLIAAVASYKQKDLRKALVSASVIQIMRTLKYICNAAEEVRANTDKT